MSENMGKFSTEAACCCCCCCQENFPSLDGLGGENLCYSESKLHSLVLCVFPLSFFLILSLFCWAETAAMSWAQKSSSTTSWTAWLAGVVVFCARYAIVSWLVVLFGFFLCEKNENGIPGNLERSAGKSRGYINIVKRLSTIFYEIFFFYYFVLSALRESSFCLNCKAEEYEGESSDNSQGRHDLPLVKLSFIGTNFSPSGNTSEILNHVVQSEQKLDQHPNGETATIIPRWIELVRSSTNIDRLVTREQKVHQKYASSETKADGCISLVNRLVSRWLETWSSLK